MCPMQGLESCQTHFQAQRERQSNFLLARGRMGAPSCVNKRAGWKTVCSWFRSEFAYGHREVRRRWWRPTARCPQQKKRRYMSKNWTYSWQWCFLKKFPQCFHWGFSAMNMGTRITGKAVKNHFSPKMAREFDCNISNNVPFVVPGLSTSSSSSSSPASSTSSLQDSVFDISRYTENQYSKEVEVRVRSKRETPMHKPTATENKNKNEGRKRYKAIKCMTCLTGCRSSEKIRSMKVVL